MGSVYDVDPLGFLLRNAQGGALSAPVPGDPVQEGQTLLVMEAMKMQNELKTSTAGTVSTVHVQEGSTVETGARLITVATPEV